MTNPTRSTPVRVGFAIALGAATLGVTACGSSTSSTPSTSSTTATSVTSTTTTPSATDSSTASASPSATDSSATDSSTPMASASDSASSTGGTGAALTATQLDKAVAATVIEGQKIVPLSQADLKQVRELMAESVKHMQNVTISPAACRDTINLAQLGGKMGATNSPMSIGESKNARYSLAATQLPAGSPSTWKDDQIQKCSHMTMKGTFSGIAVDESVSMTPIAVTSSQATDAHGMVQTTVNRGKTTVSSLAVARVGDVAIETERQGTATAAQLSSDLDALATQIKKVG